MRRGLTLLLLLMLLAQSASLAAASGEDGGSQCTASAVLRVAVVGFSVPGMSRVAEMLGAEHVAVTVGSCKLNITVVYDVFEAPDWALDRLREGLGHAYVELGRPSWLPGFLDKPVRWVELTLYEDLVAATVSAMLGTGYDHVVAVVGDVDGYSRQLYHIFYHEGTANGTVWVTGLRLWTSPRHPLTILDLTAAPRPWPQGVPLEEYGVRVDPSREVYAWNSSLVPAYVADMARRIVYYHVLGGLNWWPQGLTFPENLSVKTIIVYSDHDTALRVSRELEQYLEHTLRAIYPYGGLTYSIELHSLEEYPELAKLVAETPVDREGYLTIPLRKLKPIAEEIAEDEGAKLYSRRAVFVFILLVLDKPARLSLPRLLFTGISMGSWAVAAYPGHNHRMARAGVATAIAHELGHSLGEKHPFNPPAQGYTVDWRLDYAGTPMTYYNPVQAALAASPAYQGAHEKHLSSRMLARLIATLYENGQLDTNTTSRLLAEAIHDPDKAYTMLQRLQKPTAILLVAPGAVEGIAVAVLVITLLAAVQAMRRTP